MAASGSYILIQVAPLESNFTLLLQNHGNTEEVITSDFQGATSRIDFHHITAGPQVFSESSCLSQGSLNAQVKPTSRITNQVKLEPSESSALQNQDEAHRSYTKGLQSSSRNSAIITQNIVNHAKHKPFMCTVCSASFHLSCHLKAHQNIHIGKEVFTCDICSASFTKKYCLTQHLKSYSRGLCKPTSVFAVDSTLGSFECLNERPYKCDVCPATFTRPRQLKLHALIHTGERPYKCEHCGASFLKLFSLKCHVRTHTGEKPYECQLCPAQFSESGKLGRHMRTHTGEKPHKCQLCPAAFVQKGNLKSHMNTHRHLEKDKKS